MGKASSERCTKQEHTAPAKPLVAIGELQFDYVSSKNDRSNKKILISNPGMSLKDNRSRI